MKILSLLPVVFAAGCVSQATVPEDLFSRQSDFAADRQREVIRLNGLNAETASIQVTEVLMDLGCTLQESNQQLGVISARGIRKVIARESALAMPTTWQGCAGHRVTVTVRETASKAVSIRASFEPPEQAADRTFRNLLRSSLTLDAATPESRRTTDEK